MLSAPQTGKVSPATNRPTSGSAGQFTQLPADRPTVQPPPATLAWAAKFAAFGFLLCAMLAGLLFWQLRRPVPVPIVLQPPPTAAPTALPQPSATPGPVTVFVSGGVSSPGLYRLAWDARVGDALLAAGGLLPDTDPALVNQAQALFDGAQIHVPLPVAEEVAASPPEAAQSVAPPVGLSGNAPAPTSSSGAASAGAVNLNSASAEALIALPGIGPSKAAAIIANRPYESVADLERVPGIGPKTVAQLAPLVTAP